MDNSILWRRLTKTDFNAMNAEASPYGAGGGARHIALGVRSPGFPIDDFLGVPGGTEASIDAISPTGVATLEFDSNPGRRGGEWTIRNQYSHRHPAWRVTAGFPSTYDKADRPYVLVIKVDDKFYARFARESTLSKMPDVPPIMLTRVKGITFGPSAFLSAQDVPITMLLEAFEDQEASDPADEFDPSNYEDGRQKVFAAIIRRQGQPKFRQALITAYGGQCAISRTRTPWVLEAAHITPYRGKLTNTLSNGLLLRADLHTLFDLGLISVRPDDRIIAVSTTLKKSSYWSLRDRPLHAPKKKGDRPSEAALRKHFSQFRT